MSEKSEQIRRKMRSATDLLSVVRTMKTMAASNVTMFERAVDALGGYSACIELGLNAWFRSKADHGVIPNPRSDGPSIRHPNRATAIVFGSDQGLVGQFNDRIREFTTGFMETHPAEWTLVAIGERVHNRLREYGLSPNSCFPVPNDVHGITPLVSEIQMKAESLRVEGEVEELHVFFNIPSGSTTFQPHRLRLLPLDEQWQQEISSRPWPGPSLPEIAGRPSPTLRALVRSWLFIMLFRACAESMASENASRLAAMQRAEKNIDEMLENLQREFHHQRQMSIDAELFDVIAGFEAQSSRKH